MKKISAFFILMFLCGEMMLGQDMHFSQYNASPLNLNPATAGLFDGDYRFVANHKTQWASVSLPFKSYSGSVDARLLGNPAKTGMLSAGLLFNSDRAGDSQLGIAQAGGNLSFTMKLDKSSNFLTLGTQVSFAQRSLSYDKLIFDEQYDGDAYNSNLSNGEFFGDQSYSYLDASLGLIWTYVASEKVSTSIGLSRFHLNKPTLGSFNNSNAEKLEAKNSLHGGIRFRLFGRTDLIPSVLYSNQKKYSEVLFGTNLRFGFEPNLGFSNAFYLGAHWRNKDAFVALVGLEYNNLNIGVSYDVNTSSLKPASNNRGGFELSLIYIIKKVKPLNGIKLPCPTYL